MRHNLCSALSLAALFAVLVSGCQQIDSPPELRESRRPAPRDAAAGRSSERLAERDAYSLPGGQTPPSYQVRAAEDGNRVISVPARRVQSAGYRQPGPAAWLGRPCPTQTTPPARLSEALAFARAPDYHWLVGSLQHDPARDVWSVRYDVPDSPDRYGGQLDLVNQGPMTGFEPGRLVRVEGELFDPAPQEITPVLRVHSIQMLSSLPAW